MKKKKKTTNPHPESRFNIRFSPLLNESSTFWTRFNVSQESGGSMPVDRSPLGKKRELPILDLSLSSTGCLVRWNVGTGWQEGVGDLGQTLNDSVLHPSWIVATRGAGLRSIKGGGGGLEGRRVERGGERRERRDRDERSTGHTRVLSRALQVLQCRPVPAWVSGSSPPSSWKGRGGDFRVAGWIA